ALMAKNISFDKNCLAAPANKPFSIRFTNEDAGVPHNVAILSSGKELFTGEIVTGPKTSTYRVEALPAGTYEFHCDVHPSMKGTFVSK
ncbi:MAG TPA: cupredoxin domain-containing protein, partial [Actinomycetota bacterium]